MANKTSLRTAIASISKGAPRDSCGPRRNPDAPATRTGADHGGHVMRMRTRFLAAVGVAALVAGGALPAMAQG